MHMVHARDRRTNITLPTSPVMAEKKGCKSGGRVEAETTPWMGATYACPPSPRMAKFSAICPPQRGCCDTIESSASPGTWQ